MENLKYGKKITTESFFDGKMTKNQVSYSIPVIIKDKSQTLTEIIKSIDLISLKKTRSVTITIKSDDSFNLKMLTKEYIVEKII